MMAAELLSSLIQAATCAGGDGEADEAPESSKKKPQSQDVANAQSGEVSDASSHSSAVALPFEHVATPSMVEELNRFAVITRQQYEKVLPRNSSETPRFSWEDVSIDCVLGEGAFSFVFQVRIEKKSKEFTPDKAHALKCLKAKAVSATNDLVFNAMDLQVEAEILSRVNHPHIIALSGISDYALGDSYLKADGYFVLLEIMEMTLLDKFQSWRNEMEYDRRQRKMLLSKESMIHRLLTVAVPVASAMEYLHSHSIVLRDLKPENVGFDCHGHVKLFDFGLSRLVDTVAQDDIAGSVCYMAPEILLEQGTHLASDVYSLAMVTWELCTLELPMGRFQTMDQVKQRVAKGNWRPALSGIPIRQLRKTLIYKGWARNVSDRPSAHDMHQGLQQVCRLDLELDESISSQNSSVAKSLPPHPSSKAVLPPKRTKSFQMPGRSIFMKKG